MRGAVMKSKLYLMISILVLVLINLTGCMSYTTLQSPKTLDGGEVLFGAGVSSPDVRVPLIEVNTRVGIIRNFDIGAKFDMGSLIFLDGKYQILRDPINISADLGWSYFSHTGNFGESKGKTTCWYPMIIAGQDHWYVGVKRVHWSTEGEFEIIGDWKYSGSGWFSTNVVAGGIVGEKVRFMPEVNFIFPDSGERTLIVPAIGIQFILQ
jgi:hypothetical protein